MCKLKRIHISKKIVGDRLAGEDGDIRKNQLAEKKKKEKQSYLSFPFPLSPFPFPPGGIPIRNMDGKGGGGV